MIGWEEANIRVISWRGTSMQFSLGDITNDMAVLPIL